MMIAMLGHERFETVAIFRFINEMRLPPIRLALGDKKTVLPAAAPILPQSPAGFYVWIIPRKSFFLE
jgi:hypothetical protein